MRFFTRLYKAPGTLIGRYGLPRPHYCPNCDCRLHAFLPYRGARPPLAFALHGVGSRVDMFSCPHCRAHDRERHLLLYMRKLGLLEALRGKDVLHAAPEQHLQRHIAALNPSSYVRCDLFPAADDVQRVDLLDMPFESASFDMAIANHVLEHVGDDARALNEIARVLRPGGLAILQTPYSAMLESTWEDPGITSKMARLQAYGQEDHVRLFGRDIFKRFEASGLRADIHQHDECLADMDPDVYGVNSAEPLFLYRKPDALTKLALAPE